MIGMLVVSQFFCNKSGSGAGGCTQAPQAPTDTLPNPPINRGSLIITPIELSNDTINVRIIPWNIYGIWDTIKVNGQSDKERFGDYNVGFRIDQVELIVNRDKQDTTKRYTMRVTQEKTDKIPVRFLQPTRFYDPNPYSDTIITPDNKNTTYTHRVIGTWDEGAFRDQVADNQVGEFLYRSHEGFEVFSRAGFIPNSFEAIVPADSSKLTLVWRDSLGNRKSITLELKGYEVTLISPDSNPVTDSYLFWCVDGLARTEPGDNTEISMYQIYYRDGEKKIPSPLKAASRTLPSKIESGPFEWVALRGRYFTTIVLPSEAVSGVIRPHHTADRRMGMRFTADGENKFRLYFGPQDYQMLQKMGHRLPRIVELGGAAFRWLSVGMLYIFQFLYKVIPNYGVAIIIFSLLIKLIFLPLSQMQQRSMQKMQVLQPKIKEIQKRYERFGKDPEKQKQMNDEIMRLYRDHKASPFSGCLPMLIQLPVFFGLYAVLRNAIELRGAQFVKLFTVHVNNPINLLGFIKIPAGNLVWLADLSQYDPFYILPLLMGVASVFQSLRTNVDPRQRLMTLIFPIIITVVFLNFPSGLQLYWLVFNLLSLLELTIFKRGTQTGGTQWQKTKPGEIPSGMNLPKSSPK